jgi:hypothetical protein
MRNLIADKIKFIPDSSKVDGGETKKLDGKEQPINQYSIKSKEAGKNTKSIKEGWYDSITTAHNMLVNVNKELDQILRELREISDALNNVIKNEDLDDFKTKFNNVFHPMNQAVAASSGLVKSFNENISDNLKKAGSAIDKFTSEDFKKLEGKIDKKTAEKTKDLFARIQKLKTSMNGISFTIATNQYVPDSNSVKIEDSKKLPHSLNTENNEESIIVEVSNERTSSNTSGSSAEKSENAQRKKSSGQQAKSDSLEAGSSNADSSDSDSIIKTSTEDGVAKNPESIKIEDTESNQYNSSGESGSSAD